jgi:hypothetical protein
VSARLQEICARLPAYPKETRMRQDLDFMLRLIFDAADLFREGALPIDEQAKAEIQKWLANVPKREKVTQ